MAGNAEVLREYLVSLGFQVNQTEAKKFDVGLANWDKKAISLAKSLVGVATAAQAMVVAFSYQMEKLYYASKRTDSAASSIKALEFGAAQVGVSAGSMRTNLEALARNLRANPGLQGLLNSLGVAVKGRDMSDVATDLVEQLSKMPFYIARQYGNIFGINEDDLYLLIQGKDEFKRIQQMRKDMATEMGVDTDKLAESGKEYAQMWREIVERGIIFKDKVLQEALPFAKEMAKSINGILIDLSKMLELDFETFVNKYILKKNAVLFPTDAQMKADFEKNAKGGGVELSKESKARLGMAADEPSNPNTGGASTRWIKDKYGNFMRWAGAKGWQSQSGDERSVDAAQDASAFKKGGSLAGDPRYVPNGRGGFTYNAAANGKTDPGSAGGAAGLFARLEAQYGLPPGTLDRIWKAESNRGDPRFMKSGAGAEGHFGFMPGTAKDMGVQDPYDLTDSANGSAKYFAQLLKKYNGDYRKAAAAYNWGPGNVDKKGLGQAPKETRDYMDKVAGPAANVNAETTIIVDGSKDPKAVANAVAEKQKEVNADLFRNQTVRVF